MVYDSDMNLDFEDLGLISWIYSTGLDACKQIKNFID